MDYEAEQARLHAIAAKFLGAIRMGGGPYTNEVVRKRIQEHLAKKHAYYPLLR